MTLFFMRFCLNVQYDLELVFVKNNHVFIEEYMKMPDYIALMRKLKALGDGNEDQGKFKKYNFDIICGTHS